MSYPTLPDSGFLGELIPVIERNLSNERFGVSELAEELHMSRSNLLRKVRKETELSVSQLISQVRLRRAMELLRTTSLNVSEVAHEVGFNSPSYFIKCFREQYGYPPGEVGDHPVSEAPGVAVEQAPGQSRPPRRIGIRPIILTATTLIVLAGAFFFFSRTSQDSDGDKSIAVLPFKNDSNDSSNIYLINGLMESTLNNLQQIRDLRVVSRTSVEKYRHSSATIPEIGRELDVRYCVEGSGQKIGDRIVLNIQLIDTETDKHIWSRQYRRESHDIFELQEEIAKDISDEIKVVITPDESRRITRKPTSDPVAYDYYLKGKDLFYRSGPEDLRNSLPWFEKAIERDPKFSLAYATAAMVRYYLDIFNIQKKYTAEIDNLAEKAILYDEQSSESMVAKALSFAQKGKYELSIPYFEKALQYDSRSGLVLHFLTEFYNIHVPNPPKYLQYAIMKVQIDHATDSNTASFNYFHLSNALMQNGFLQDALKYNEKALALHPDNFFAGFVNDYIHYAIDCDPAKAVKRLTARWKRDTSRFDILHEIGKMNFMTGNYRAAASCYDRSLAVMRAYGMDIYKHEYLRIAMTYQKIGESAKAEEFAEGFREYAETNLTMYKDLHLACYQIYRGDNEKAIAHLKKLASEQDNFLFWLLLMRSDPMFKDLLHHPGFETAMKEIERKISRKHEEMEAKWGDVIRDL